MTILSRLSLLLTLSVLLSVMGLQSHATEKKLVIVTSIAPLHSMTTTLVGDHAVVEILSNGASNPHGHSMKPSDLKKIIAADIFVQIGPQLESSLQKPLKENLKGAILFSLMEAEEMRLYDLRKGGVWEAEHDHEDHKEHADHEEHAIDPHLWLDIQNMKKAAVLLSKEIIKKRPDLQDAVTENLQHFLKNLDQLDQEISNDLNEFHTTPYLVFHDAYQYFEKSYGLKPAGAVLLDPERQLGAKRVSSLHAFVKENKITCAFKEPQFKGRILTVLQEDTDLKIATLDPLGMDLKRGPTLYPTLLRALAKSLKECLN